MVQAIKFFVVMVALLNPFSVLPVFLNLTQGLTRQEIEKCCRQAALTVFLSISCGVLFGEQFFSLMGITVDDFRIGGGLVLLVIGLRMLFDSSNIMGSSGGNTENGSSHALIGIVPIGIPMLIGPGVITAVIVNAQQAHSVMNYAVLISVAAILAILIYICLRLARPIGRLIGDSGNKILINVMAVIVCAIAANIITTGLGNIFPSLEHVKH